MTIITESRSIVHNNRSKNKSMIVVRISYTVTKCVKYVESKMKLTNYIHCLQIVFMILLVGLVFSEPLFMKKGKEKMQEKEVSYPHAKAYVCESQMEKPKIAITFDDGPNIVHTPRLLDGLKKRNVKATFFLLGQNMETEEAKEIVRRMYKEGHLIGNHTYHHLEIPKLTTEEAIREIKNTENLIEEITGEKSGYFRPPYGAWDKNLEKYLSVIPILWTVDPRDWDTSNKEEIVNKVVTQVKENDIILLHDCYDSSVEAALEMIDILKKRGYEFVTVEQLIMD